MADIHPIIQKIEAILATRFALPEYAHLFVIEIRMLPNETLNLFLDSDTGVTLEECAEISRFLESFIEENQLLGEAYTIEVSSPGVSRPLALPRQYPKHIGREVSVETIHSHVHIKGILEAVTEAGLTITYTEKVVVEGTKKKKNVDIRKEIPFAEIKKTLVKVSFKEK
jgi:ribosome maturation factor RimP